MEKDNRNKNKQKRVRMNKKQHYRNISKAQARSQQNNSTSSSLPIETLEQINNDVIEKIIDISDYSDEEVDQGDDFSLLQSSNDYGASHFAFSSEKNWEMDKNEIILNSSNENSYFNLNLKLLSAGLETIPFNIRMNYPSNDFDEEELKHMKREARIHQFQYEIIFKDFKPTGSSSILNKNVVVNESKQKIFNIPKTDIKDDEAELHELLNLTNNNLNLIHKTTPNIVSSEDKKDKSENLTDKESVVKSSNITDDMQEWLDLVLE